jgi:hypothetical protein
MVFRSLIACCLLATISGCTHVQLRKNVTNQARTVGDFHRQQVLNNLALFAYDFNALPSFSFPNQSSAFVTDQATAGVAPGFGRPTGGPAGVIGQFLFTTLGINLTGSRAAQEGFTVTPVNDPRKLELMRCAYQKVLSNCGRGEMARNCPDCKTRFNVFYTGDPTGDIRAGANGQVTSECLGDQCWLKIACEKCAKKHCHCCYQAHYCGVHIWVPPEGSDELTKLTLMILDFALHDPPSRLMKQVTYNIDEFGLPTDKQRAVGTVTAQIAINERNQSLLSFPRTDEARVQELLEGQLQVVRQKLADPQYKVDHPALLTEEASLERKIEYLKEQLRVGGLKEEFSPVGPAPIAPFSIIPQLQQQIQTLFPPSTLN